MIEKCSTIQSVEFFIFYLFTGFHYKNIIRDNNIPHYDNDAYLILKKNDI